MSVLLFSLLTNAQAACPSPWNDDACDNSECTKTGSVVTCDMTAESGSCTAYAVSEYSTDFFLEVFGDYDGTEFCCQFNQVTEVILDGSDYADTLGFSWSGLTHNLDDDGATDVIGAIYGNDGADVIAGSHSPNFVEELHGGAGTDTMNGNGGDDDMYGDGDTDTMNGGGHDDTMEGGGAFDTMSGGSGDDVMRGGDGDDVMLGGAGDDNMFGESGIDRMSGGPDDDDMTGGDGADVLCGDGEVNGDYLTDSDANSESPNPDRLWSASTADKVDCYDNSTLTDGNATPGGPATCTQTLTTRPVGCP